MEYLKRTVDKTDLGTHHVFYHIACGVEQQIIGIIKNDPFLFEGRFQKH